MGARRLTTTEEPGGMHTTSWDRITRNFAHPLKSISLIPATHRPAAYWKARGVKVCIFDHNVPGSLIPAPADACRFEQANTLVQGDINPGSPAKTIDQWGDEEAERWATWMGNFSQSQDTTDSVDEDYTGGLSVNSIFRPELYYKLMAAVGRKFKALGLRYFKTYAGDCYPPKPDDPHFTNSERWAAVLDDINAALTALRPGGFANHRNNPAFDAPTPGRPNMFAEGCHALINFYFASASANGDPEARYAEFWTGYETIRNGLLALGLPDTWICMFFWLANTEFSGYQSRVVRNVPAGGTVTTDNFPCYSYKWQLAMTTKARLQKRAAIFCWDNGQAFGNDQNKVPYDFGTPGNSYIHYDGSGATRADISRSDYSTTQAEHAYPLKDISSADALPEGCELAEQLSGWVNDADFLPCPNRKQGASTWLTTNKSQLIRAWQQKGAESLLGQSGNRRSLYAFNFSTDWQTYDFDLNGKIVTRTLAPGSSYEECFTI